MFLKCTFFEIKLISINFPVLLFLKPLPFGAKRHSRQIQETRAIFLICFVSNFSNHTPFLDTHLAPNKPATQPKPLARPAPATFSVPKPLSQRNEMDDGDVTREDSLVSASGNLADTPRSRLSDETLFSGTGDNDDSLHSDSLTRGRTLDLCDDDAVPGGMLWEIPSGPSEIGPPRRAPEGLVRTPATPAWGDGAEDEEGDVATSSAPREVPRGGCSTEPYSSSGEQGTVPALSPALFGGGGSAAVTPRGTPGTYASPGHIDSVLRGKVLAECAPQPTMSALVPDPFSASGLSPSARTIVAFGKGPLSPAERAILNEFGENSGDLPPAVAKMVGRLFSTIRLQRDELERAKKSELALAKQTVDEERARHSLVQRRRSLLVTAQQERMRRIQEELDALRKEHALCAKNRAVEAELETLQEEHRDCVEYVRSLETQLEKSDEARKGFVLVAQQHSDAVREDAEPAEVLRVIRKISRENIQTRSSSTTKDNNYNSRSSRSAEKKSDAKQESGSAGAVTGGGAMSQADYANRLLDLERLLKATEGRCDLLLKEKAALEIRLAQSQRYSLPDTPSSLPSDSPHGIDDTAALRVRLHESEEQAHSLRADVDELTEKVERLSTQRDAIRSDAHSLGLEIDELTAESTKLRVQLSSAREDQNSSATELAALHHKYTELSRELTENTIQAVRDLESRENALQDALQQVTDRDRAIATHEATAEQMRESVSYLEQELLKQTQQLLEKSKRAGMASAAGAADADDESNPDRVLDEVDAAAAAADRAAGRSGSGSASSEELAQKVAEVVSLQIERNTLTKSIESLREELQHWKSTAYKEAANQQNTGDRGIDGHGRRLTNSFLKELEKSTRASEDSFLRRLSAKLVGDPSSSHDLVAKLVERVETLMTERREFEASIEALQEDILAREKKTHAMRSEFSAEVTALNAEVSQVENDRDRAVADREAAELRFLEAAKRDSRSSIASSMADDDTRRSMLSGSGMEFSGVYNTSCGDGEDLSQWRDPSIRAAIQSLNVLIGSKAAWNARSQSLKERLDKLMRRSGAYRSSGFGGVGGVDGSDDVTSSSSARALVMESKTMNEELVKIVHLQQKVIDKLRSSTEGDFMTANSTSTMHREFTSTTGRRDGAFRSSTSDRAAAERGGSSPSVVASGRAYSHAARRPSMTGPIRHSLVDATDFLQEQLADMRALSDDRAKANAVLHGVIREIEGEVERISSARDETTAKLEHMRRSNAGWLERVGRVVGASAKFEDVEVFLHQLVQDVASQELSLKVSTAQNVDLKGRVCSLLAQKRVLSHLIYLYQTRYQLDILHTDTSKPTPTPVKLRRVFNVILAVVRARRAGKFATADDSLHVHQQPPLVLDLTSKYDLPPAHSLTNRRAGDTITLESAVIALRAIPRLEAGLVQRDSEISRLRASLAALEFEPAPRTAPRDAAVDAFDYNKDVVERKNDLARRLRKALKQREELSLRLAREKNERQSLEVRVAKYMDKLSSYQKRLGKARNESDARDRTYKAAIRFLQSKAENAVVGDENFDLTEMDTAALLDRKYVPESSGASRAKKETETNPNRRATLALEDQIRAASRRLATQAPDSEIAREMTSYIQGLEKVMREIGTSRSFGASLSGGQQ